MAQTRLMGKSQQVANRIVVEDNIEVKAPIQQVYNRWNDFTRFPEFMRNVEDVRQLGGNRYHWVARIFGIKEEWDAEVTEREPERRISWRSISGAPNAGTVSFSRLGPEKTEVRVRMEYTPPAGTFGKSLAQLTRPVRREAKEDLKNFKLLLEGRGHSGQQMHLTEQMNQLLQQMPELRIQMPEILDQVSGSQAGNVLGALTIPIAAGVAGGLVSLYAYEQMTKRFSLTDPSTWIARPTAQIARWRMGGTQSPLALREPINSTASVASWSLIGASAASILGAAGLRFANRRHESLFVGQWAPTLLGMSLLARMIGNRHMRHNRLTNAVSWGLISACFGSIGASVFNRIRGKKHDSLFIGLWAPTFLGAATLARQLSR